MSAQTGEEVPNAPTSSRGVDRTRFRVELLSRDPNPIWIRELRQSSRLGRTPIILMVVTVLMTLVIASLGGTMSNNESSDKVGVAVYQTYFSLAFFLVAWLGPAVAANSIASEREGRTWEAVLLTGLRPEVIARGKFLAAMTAISTYIVMLAPVGALAFLFGGVTASEVLIAFGYLFLFALLFVALGLAVSSKMESLRASILVTLLMCVPLSMFCFGFLGMAMSEPVHELWRQVPRKLPVWLPTAYIRGDFGAPYALILIVLPLVTLGVPTWFLYESTIANLKGANENRSTGMKRWYVVSTAALVSTAVAGMAIVKTSGVDAVGVMSLVFLALFLAFVVLVFAGEPISPSRRVNAEWARERRPHWVRFFGPSIVNAAILELVVGCSAIAGVSMACLRMTPWGGLYADIARDGFLRLVAYTVGFFVFLVGFSAWIRVKSATVVRARVLVVAGIAVATIVPWVIAAIAGVLTQQAEDGIFIAAPSPVYAFFMLDEARHAVHDATAIFAGWVCIFGWGLLGLVFLAIASAKSRRRVAEAETAVAETDRRLALEDAALEDAALQDAAREPASLEHVAAEP